MPHCQINDANVISLVQFFHAYGPDQARRTFLITTISTVNPSEACEDARSCLTRVINEAASMVLLDERLQFQWQWATLKTRNVTRVQGSVLVHYVSRENGRPIGETGALNLSFLTKKVTVIKLRDSSFVATVKSVMNYSTAFERAWCILSCSLGGGYCIRRKFVRLPDQHQSSDLPVL